jgi:carbamoyl-phosphate synthase small subunit
MKKRYLVLADGQVFEGAAFGADAEAVGELVFTTGMCGYIETLTDPSYAGQIVLQTFPLIGNYGIIPADFEGACRVRGYVVREACGAPSNFRCGGTLDAYLAAQGVPGSGGVDSRRITELIREKGVMNATLCDAPPADLSAVRAYAVTGAVQAVTCPAPVSVPADGEERFRVALIDYGAKANIARSLAARGCRVDVLPCSTPAETVLAGGYDGVMLSNGPGDPAENAFEIAQIAKLFGRLPLFGICLGHQLLALARGAETRKLKFGHRGANQPVREVTGTRTYITSQNHGYAVVSETVKEGVVRFENANDRTCEGISYPDAGAFSVQFHPEACAGPRDTAFLFDEFCALMKG